MSGDAVVEQLIAALEHDNEYIRIEAAEDLVRLGKRSLKHIIPCLQNGSERAIVHIIDVLGMIGDPTAVAPLMKLLYDEDYYLLRVDIRLALVRIGSPAVDPLIKALESKQSGVRHCAVLALASLRDLRAADPLMMLLDDPNTYIREDAEQALYRMGIDPDDYAQHGTGSQAI